LQVVGPTHSLFFDVRRFASSSGQKGPAELKRAPSVKTKRKKRNGLNFRVASDPYADMKRTAATQQKKTM
jgi:hypothetical protein